LLKNYKGYVRLVISFIVFFVILLSCPGKKERELLEQTIDASTLYDALEKEDVPAIVELLKSGITSWHCGKMGAS